MPGSASAISPKSVNSPKRGQIGLFAAMSIGIGGMVGAGIFSILGVRSCLAHRRERRKQNDERSTRNR
ncbi:MAG: hypothetical protein ACLQO6_20355 [Desulfomonilaceae bacterium]